EELEKGLALKGRTDHEYIGLRYEIAKVSEMLGDQERRAAELLKIHEVDSRYRDVAKQLKKLGVSGKPAGPEAKNSAGRQDKVSYL
ncbi:MAG: hypothetical protein R3231_01085, partial [bacterium]|nr:hypothetical protein [bacterium]